MASKKRSSSTKRKASAAGKHITREISFPDPKTGEARSFFPGDEAAFVRAKPSQQILERLITKGAITGKWNLRDAPDEEELVEEESTITEPPAPNE